MRVPAACSPCHINEGGTKVVHAVHAIVEVLDSLSGFWREELEGECSFAGLLGICQFLRDVHGCLETRPRSCAKERVRETAEKRYDEILRLKQV